MAESFQPQTSLAVSIEWGGKTLSAVVKHMQGLSWSDTKKLIEQRRVAVNGVVCIDEVRRMIASDQVEVATKPLNRPVSSDDVTVYHVDSDLIVLEKPSGIISLRHFREIDWPYERRKAQPTLDEIALEKIGLMMQPPQDLTRWTAKVRRQNVRAVHRIDRETSGLVVFARNLEAEQKLIAQFAAHTVERVYLTVCWGHVKDGTIRSHFIRDRGDGLRGSTPVEHEGKIAITHFKLLQKLGQHSLVECRLETGRTHQIRLHLTEAGHPLCGDPMYRSGFQRPPIPDNSGAKRLALHAHKLEFTHPTNGGRVRFESPLPRDLAALVERLQR